tara:strand:+ start:279 stop:1487 length:1209 start_codon:yes stop_codon:yes gene_type:complete
MPDISTINGVAEDNIASWNGTTAGNVTSVNGDTWVHMATEGKLWSAGEANYSGRSGAASVPTQIGSATNWTSITTDKLSAMAINTDGDLYAWGYDATGVLGLGAVSGTQVTPAQVGSKTWSVARANSNFSHAIDTDGKLWATGEGADGRLGTGNTTDRNTFIQIGSATNWVSLSKHTSGHARTTSAAAINSSGELYTWGKNAGGQLGHGNTTSLSVPTKVGSDTDWASVCMSGEHTMALKTTGTMFCSGANTAGEFGNGSTTSTSSFVQIGSDSNWAQAVILSDDDGDSGRHGHSLAVKTTGTVWSTGTNYKGQLGHGNTTNLSSWTQIGSASNWLQVSVGVGSVSNALATNGQIYGWGKGNKSSGAGIGGVLERSVPIQIGSGSDWIEISTNDTAGYFIGG